MSGLNASHNAGHKQARKHRKKWCEHCHTTQHLQVHHRDRNPLNNELHNCQTLCVPCHQRVHVQAGDWGRPRPPQKQCAMCKTAFQPKSHASRAKLCRNPDCLAENGRQTAARRWRK